jgi:hypothetical protein
MPEAAQSISIRARRRGQRGAATLIVTTLLMLLMSLTSITAARLGAFEEKAVAAEQRIREAKQAAQAGLVHALAWLKETPCAGGCDPITTPVIATASGYTFAPVVTFQDVSGYLLVRATAVANEEPTIRAVAQQMVRQTSLLSRLGRLAPPILVDGCLTNVAGGPIIYPRPSGDAVLSLATNTPGDGRGCIEVANSAGNWHVDVELCTDAGVDIACPPDTSISSSPVTDEATYLGGTDLSSLPEPRAWNYMFDISLSDALSEATAAGQVYAVDTSVPPGPAPEVPFIIYTGTTAFNGTGTQTYGTAERPVVLIMSDPGCPKLNGSVTVYGYVYYQGDPALGRCSGWGGATITGTLILETSGDGFNANTAFFDQSNLGVDPNEVLYLDGVTALSGTWKDW